MHKHFAHNKSTYYYYILLLMVDHAKNRYYCNSVYVIYDKMYEKEKRKKYTSLNSKANTCLF